MLAGVPDGPGLLLVAGQIPPLPGQIFPGAADLGVVTEVHPSLGAPAVVHSVDDPALLALPGLLLVAQTGQGAA